MQHLWIWVFAYTAVGRGSVRVRCQLYTHIYILKKCIVQSCEADLCNHCGLYICAGGFALCLLEHRILAAI